ncbi:MAG TPA: transaldolase family protein, partial [Roseiflexaceae bacterium]
VMYVEELIGPHTVNTMPPATMAAFKDHGRAEARLTQGVDEALGLLAQLEALGVDYTALTERLQVEGVESFATSFEALLSNLAARSREILLVSR